MAGFHTNLTDRPKRLAVLGATPTGSTPEQMGKMVTADTVKWTQLIRDRKIIVD